MANDIGSLSLQVSNPRQIEIVKIVWSQILKKCVNFRTRGTATGLTAALSYVLSFISAKTFYSLETTLSMPGVALFNCIIIAIGIVLMYKILPETENRTLEDIEMHFSDGSKKITDRKIHKQNFKPNGWDKDSQIPTRTISAASVDELNRKNCENGCENQAFHEW